MTGYNLYFILSKDLRSVPFRTIKPRPFCLDVGSENCIYQSVSFFKVKLREVAIMVGLGRMVRVVRIHMKLIIKVTNSVRQIIVIIW